MRNATRQLDSQCERMRLWPMVYEHMNRWRRKQLTGGQSCQKMVVRSCHALGPWTLDSFGTQFGGRFAAEHLRFAEAQAGCAEPEEINQRAMTGPCTAVR